MRRARSRIRARLFAYFALIALLVALSVYLLLYLAMSPSLKRTAYESLRDSARAQMAAVDQSIRSLNSVSVAITHSSRVRAAMERLNAQGRLPHDALTELSDHLVFVNGPMLPAAEIRLYALEKPVMVATGMVNGQYAYSPGALPWLAEVLARDGAKVLSLPAQDGALIKYNRYIALRRVVKQSFRSQLGVVEVVADAMNLLDGVSQEGPMDVFIWNGDGALVYPLGGSLPDRVREAMPGDGSSGILELEEDLVAWRTSSECDWTLAAVRARSAVLAPLNAMTRTTLWMLGGLLALALGLAYLASRQFTRPIHALAGRMARFTLDGQDEQEPTEPDLDELAALSGSFDQLKGRLTRSVDELMLTKQQELQSHMLALQSQMNPHFLYNTLSNLEALIDLGDNARAAHMIGSISRMLRYIGADGEGMVPVGDEIAHLDDYIECMKLRYGANLVAEIRVDEEILGLRIPKLSIQPLVENAIKYGCTRQPPWRLRVEVRGVVAGWRASVMDDGPGLDGRTLDGLIEAVELVRRRGVLPSMRIGGMGLLNIAMRLKLCYGDDFLLHIQNLNGGGARVTVGNHRGGDQP